MKIIVVGAGKVGYSLAKRLIQDDHDVYMIDKSAERIHNLESTLDVSLLQGNGSQLSVLNEIGLSDVGMFIAVTDSDEVNLLACAVAKLGGVARTIARVRDTDYAKKDNQQLQSQLGIDLFINPEMVTAQALLEILQTPAALDVEDFASGAVRLLEFKAKKHWDILDQPLKDITLPDRVLAVGILRNGDMIIPNGDTMVEAGDNVFFLGAKEGIQQLEKRFQELNQQIKHVVIIGAGLIGRNLTCLLEKAGYNVKVIEKNRDRCELLASITNTAMVIEGDGTNLDLLEAEEIGDGDVIICLTDDDKLNLLVALLAKHMGIPKAFVRVGRPEYISLMEQVGIDVVFSPRLLTSGEILRAVRSDSNLVSISTFEGSKAEAVEIALPAESTLVGRALRDIRLPGEALVGAIVRDNTTIVPSGDTFLYEGDHIIFFTLPQYVNRLLKAIK